MIAAQADRLALVASQALAEMPGRAAQSWMLVTPTAWMRPCPEQAAWAVLVQAGQGDPGTRVSVACLELAAAVAVAERKGAAMLLTQM